MSTAIPIMVYSSYLNSTLLISHVALRAGLGTTLPLRRPSPHVIEPTSDISNGIQFHSVIYISCWKDKRVKFINMYIIISHNLLFLSIIHHYLQISPPSCHAYFIYCENDRLVSDVIL